MGAAAQLAGGNRWLLGRRLGITRNSFAAWYDGSHLPSLTSLLNLSLRLNTTPLKLLTGDEVAASNVQLQLDNVREAIFTIHQQGLNPSQTKVAKLIRSNGGVLWLPEFKDAYQAATTELEAEVAR